VVLSIAMVKSRSLAQFQGCSWSLIQPLFPAIAVTQSFAQQGTGIRIQVVQPGIKVNGSKFSWQDHGSAWIFSPKASIENG